MMTPFAFSTNMPTLPNAQVTPGRRMEFRIGVNLGDVMVEGDQIYGDGVNVAARLENLAQPGSVYISASIHEQIRNKLALGFEDLGEQHVKNIAEPVRAWRVLPDGAIPVRRARRWIPRSYGRGAVFSLAGLTIIVGTVVLVQRLSLKPPLTRAWIPPAQSPALALPDKPSIAVLPFTNMSGHEQEYFSDGITDDVITGLSRLPGLFVIARNSTFNYKGKAAPLQEVGRELGVKYVLEGSVRKAAAQVRVTAQLADATSGAELWAERYDRPLRDVFALQDEIVRRIVTTLNLQIALSQQEFLPRSTENLEAYDALLRGTAYMLSTTKNGDVKARQMFEKAIELDSKYAMAYALLGANYYLCWAFGFNPDPNGLEQALHMEQQAVALDDSVGRAHSVLAAVYGQDGRYDQALGEARRGVALDPNSASGYLWLAYVLNRRWNSTEALVAVDKAMRLDPRNPDTYLLAEGWAYTSLGRWKEAIPALKRSLDRYPENLWAHVYLAADYSCLGDHRAARAEIGEVERTAALSPNSAVGYLALATVLNVQGRPAEALVAVDKAMHLDPNRDVYQWEQGWSYALLGRWEEAITALKRFLARNPDNFVAHALLAGDYMELGQDDAAQAEAAEALRLNPQLTVEIIAPKGSLIDEANPVGEERFRANLRKAGLK